MTAPDADHGALRTDDREAGSLPALGELAALRGAAVDVELARRRLRGRLFGEEHPTRVGRYEIERLLGTGGTGVVFRAHDPELGRAVAVKILRPFADDDGLANARLVREAQTIARLAHPNIVAVYEIGKDDGRIFVAMEHVDGVTLRAWSSGSGAPRPWPEALAVMLQAGRGLAAGHAANVVHRDFKPENAMLGVDGRVRVLDFGLAHGSLDVGALATPVAGITVADTSTLTPAGVVAGTPAYMAPERLWGEVGDARSDQFEFCVALFEAIWGRRPYAGATIGALRGAMAKGRIDFGPSRGEPTRLRAIVRRGLAIDPERRWPDMPALLAALERAAGRRSGPAIAATVSALGAAVVAFALWPRDDEGPPFDPCAATAARAAAVWDDGARERMVAAIAESGAAGADVAAREIDAGLVRYLDGWREQHAAACGTAATDDAGRERLEMQLGCLDARLADVGALVHVWSEPDAAVVMRASEAVAALDPVERCAELDPQQTASPAQSAARVALVESLARVKALRAAGRWADGLALAQPLLQQAVGVGHGPTTIEIRRHVALLQDDGGEYAAAEATMAQVYADAFASRQDRAAFEAALQLVTLLGERLHRHDEALVWGRRAEAVLDSGVVVDDDSRGRLRSQVGVVLHQRGDFAAALATQQEALVLLEQANTRARILVAAHHNLGMTLSMVERPEDALSHYRQAKALAEAGLARGEFGEAYLAHTLDGLGDVLSDQGLFAESEPLLRRALAIRERVLGRNHLLVAVTSMHLGVTLVALGRLDEALGHHEHAVAVSEAAVGPDHPATGAMTMNLAGVWMTKGEFAKARPLVERAMAIQTRALGPEHPSTLNSLRNLAVVAAGQGNDAEAVRLFEELLEIRRRTLGPDHAEVAETEATLAELRGAPAAKAPAAPG